MKLNGKNCIDPTVQKFLDGGVSRWWDDKANVFSLPCGVDAGEGHLFIAEQDVPTNLTDCVLKIGDLQIKVVAGRAVELLASSNSPTPTSPTLLRIYDLRHYLKTKFLDKGYNVVQRYDSSGNPVYERWSLNASASYMPWSWQAMITDIWGQFPVIAAPTLTHASAQYPSHVPQNYEFRNSSMRDALGIVLRDIGHTLVPKTDFSFSVEALVNDSTFSTLISSLRTATNPVIDLRHFTTGQASKLPQKLIFLFPYLPEMPETRERPYYRYEFTVVPQLSYQTIAAGTSRTIVVPLTAAFSVANPSTPLNKAALDAFAEHIGPRITRLIFGQSAADIVFSGFHEIYPTNAVGRVTWMDTGSNIITDGSGPVTRIEQACPFSAQAPEDQIKPLQVFKFQKCGELSTQRYFTNPEIVDHLPGGTEEATTVAVIDGECWLLKGYADRCRSGDCVDIQTWIPNCESCSFGCFLLTPCTTGSTRLVLGEGWVPHVGRVVKIDDVCYTVGIALVCEDAEELDAPAISVPSCVTCNVCWDLIKCGTMGSGEGETIGIANDLVTELQIPEPNGKIVQVGGHCYEVVGPRTCTGSETFVTLDIDPETELPYVFDTCEECGCYKLTPCAGQTTTAPLYIKEAVLKECPPSNTTTLVNLQELVGKVVMLNTGYCYSVDREVEACEDAQETPVTILESYDSCDCCKIRKFKQCGSDPPRFITTYSDLCEAMSEHGESTVIKRAEDELCYEFDSYVPNLAGDEVCLTPEAVYPNCETCLSPIYKLNPICNSGCDNDCDYPPGGFVQAPQPKYTSQDFSDIVGKFISIRGECYFVLRWFETEVTEEVCYDGVYDTCEDCLQADKILELVESVEIVNGKLVAKMLKLKLPYEVCKRRDFDIAEVGPCPEP